MRNNSLQEQKIDAIVSELFPCIDDYTRFDSEAINEILANENRLSLLTAIFGVVPLIYFIVDMILLKKKFDKEDAEKEKKALEVEMAKQQGAKVWTTLNGEKIL